MEQGLILLQVNGRGLPVIEDFSVCFTCGKNIVFINLSSTIKNVQIY